MKLHLKAAAILISILLGVAAFVWFTVITDGWGFLAVIGLIVLLFAYYGILDSLETTERRKKGYR